jgi:8-oxo-dGTP pyrophosphatase MutT (NUDIX family)
MRDRIKDIFTGPGHSPVADARRNVWPVPEDEIDGIRLRSAAVLVPLVDHDDGMTVLLTRRTDSLSAHAGQISFPGGRIEVGDTSPEDTALRETEEEIGIARAEIELVGRLKTHDTRTGFRVLPVVGLLRPPLATEPDPSEVAAIFEVPLAFILDPANHLLAPHPEGGANRQYRAVPYGEHYIWGLTARVLYDLLNVVGES